jgi:hypothetical protein
MRVLTTSDLRTLIEERGDPAVTIAMPTHRASDRIQQDPTRLKNLLDEAEARVEAWGLRAAEARSLLEPIRDLTAMETFWEHSSDGLALFRTADAFHLYRLPLTMDAEVRVSDRYHLKHLMPLLSGDGRFYILALSQNEVRLLHGSRDRVDPVELADVPPSLAEALKYDDPERQLQWHTGTATPAGGPRAAVFHGHGVATADDPKHNILRYFRKVSAGLGEILAGEEVPVVLAAVEYLIPIYLEASDYPHVLEEGVTGNPEELSAEELHDRAWAIVAPRFQRERREAERRFQQLHGAGSALASADVAEVVRAAHAERVDTLFVAVGLHRWGRFDPSSYAVEHHDKEQVGDDDLLDLAAVQTYINSGTVYAVDPSEVPGGGAVAAIMRY